MSDSTTTVVDWSEGMTPSAVAKCSAKAVAAAADIAKGDKLYLAAADKLETIYRLYLKGDRKRFEAFVSLAPLNLNGSMGYVYVQAARAGKTFASDLAKVSEPLSVQALAKLDRFTGSDDAKEIGREIIASDLATAKATGRKPLSVASVQAAVSAAASPSDVADKAERRIGNIAMKLRDDIRAAFVAAGGGDEATRVAFVAALKIGAAMGAKHGAATPLALDKLDREWKVEIVAAHVQAAAIERDGAKLAADLSAIAPSKPADKPAAKVGTVAKVAAAKRTNRKPAGLPNVAAAVKVAPAAK